MASSSGNLGTIPHVIKVSISGVAIEGCPEADDLNGDYLLPLVKSTQSHLWKLTFNNVCGFTSIIVGIAENRTGGNDLRVAIQGPGTQQPTWTARNITTANGLHNAVLIDESIALGEWPDQIRVMAIQASEESKQRFSISSQPSQATTLAAMGGSGSGSGSASAGDALCDCHGCGFIEYRLSFINIQNDECDHCTDIKTATIRATNEEPDNCEWIGPLDGTSDHCGFFDPVLHINLTEDCELEMNVLLHKFAIGPEWERTIDSCFEPNTLPLTVEPPPPDDTVCDFGTSSVTVEPVNPDNLSELNYTDCLARGCGCNYVKCLPPPELNFKCDFNITCCCERCFAVKAPIIPGVQCGTSPGCT